MNKEKNTKKRKQIITISIFSVIIIIILIFFLFFLRKTDEPVVELPYEDRETLEPVLIETEFLSEDELSDLGVSSDTRAQVISRDPLIYKVIEDDDEIVKDIAPYLQPIRE